MVVAEVETLQQAKYLYIIHAVQCVFLAYLTQKVLFIKQRRTVISILS
jgi:hypothetical protein